MTAEDQVEVEEKSRPSRKDWLVSIATLIAGVAIVAHLTRYNRLTGMSEEYLLVNTTFLLFVPFMLVFSLFREPAEFVGFRPTENRAGRIAALFFVAMVPVLLIASRSADFQKYYPMRMQAAYSWPFLVYWELTYGFYMFCWEFFYRGFLTFGLKRAFGPVMAVMLQTAAFGLMHWDKPMPEFYGSFIAAIALGCLALRGKSFYPCFLVHWAVSISFDLLAIHSKSGAIF